MANCYNSHHNVSEDKKISHKGYLRNAFIQFYLKQSLLLPRLICTWFLKFLVWKIKFEWNWIFRLFQTWFLLCSMQKSRFKFKLDIQKIKCRSTRGIWDWVLYLVRYKWKVNNISIRHNNNISRNKLLDGSDEIVKCDIRFPNLPKRKFELIIMWLNVKKTRWH